MGVSDHLVPSLCCEMKILEAKNIELKSHANLFVRYYLPAGNNRRIQLNTKQISTKSSQKIIWNESFSLECSSSEESVKYLKQQTVVFELRRRKLGKSVVLGRAEMPWKAVFEAPDMEIDEYWLPMVSMNDGVLGTGLKPPCIRLSMKMVRGPTMAEMEKRKKRKQGLKDHCEGCDCAADYEIFALAAALEGLL
ncbi:hypothetical protein like AT5G65030 [Hibiscus trionum]|uniref:C2 domain-containing protein n=1 Tax=Hibiscus trionum TaxID=183268 RepID=A0A9W7J5T8_HIBTR|nr:hypothetical protein like AT5G65030 [Hibiscus trionum]GMJ08674.1 hypothetical protein like AT5G65030 [Hibiscus trionum]